MSMKKKVIIISLIFGTIILGLVATIATVLVSMFSGMSANIKVGYMAKNVDANVTARYWTGGSGWKMLGTEDGLTFNSSSNNVSGELNQLEEEIKLEDDNNRIVFEYAFNNLSESIHLNLDLITKPTATNMDVTYYVSPAQLNAVSTINPPETLDAWTSRTIEAGDTDGAYVYIIVEAIDGVRNASFKGEFEWALEVPNECAVVYDMEGVSNYSEFTANEITLKGLPYTTVNTVPKYYASGYAFAGWYTDEARTNLFVDQTIVDENMTLYPLFYTGNVQITEEDYSEELGGYVVNDLATVTTNSVTIRGGVNSIKAAPENSIVIPDEITINGVTEPVVAVNDTLERDGLIEEVCFGSNVKTFPANFAGQDVDVNNNLFNEKLTKVYLGKGITAIPDYAFLGCINLTSSIAIPESCISIGRSAFNTCTNLTTVVIPDSVTQLAGNIFVRSGINKVQLPSYVSAIPDYMYYGCNNIISAVIPENISNVNTYVFTLCENIVSITFKNNEISTIQAYCFSNCLNLAEVKLPHQLTFLGEGVFYNCESLISINLPETINSMGDYVFYGCIKLNNINLPSGISSLGRSAFYNCQSLEMIEFPDNITSMGLYVFYGCSKLKEIDLPDGVTELGQSSFYNCTSLEKVNLPDNLISIASYVFRGCTALKSIEIPDGVTVLENYTFYGCSNLESVKLPANLLKINQQVFRDCTSLTSIEFPSTVTLVDARSFQNTRLTSLHIPAALTNIAATAFMSIPNLAYITVEDGNTVYEDRDCNAVVQKSSSQIRVGAINTVVVDSIQSIGNYAFLGRKGLKSINLNKVKNIGAEAFSGAGLIEIVIPSSVVTLQKTVFNGCAATLKRVIFEDPNNWIAHATLSEALKGNGDPVDVSNPETNALNLVNKSGYGAWKSLNLQKVVS